MTLVILKKCLKINWFSAKQLYSLKPERKSRWRISHCDTFYFWKVESVNDDLNINSPWPILPQRAPVHANINVSVLHPREGTSLSFSVLEARVESSPCVSQTIIGLLLAKMGVGFSLCLLLLVKSSLDQLLRAEQEQAGCAFRVDGGILADWTCSEVRFPRTGVSWSPSGSAWLMQTQCTEA